MTLYLGAALEEGRAEALLAEEPGVVLARGSGPTLEAALEPCLEALGERTARILVAGRESAVPSKGCACQAVPLAPQEAEPGTWPSIPLDHALLAGALGGSPGLVVHGANRAHVLAADRTGRLHRVPADPRRAVEAGAEALVHRALAVARDEALATGRRLRRALERADPLEAVLAQADYPGPDPHLRGLVVGTVRRLAALAREARCRLPGPGRVEGSWTGPLMRPPLLALFEQEVFRHAPEIRWRPPLLGAAAGALLLARAGVGGPADRLRLLFRQGRPAKAWVAALAGG